MWVALMAVSLTAQETGLQDQPSESDTPDTAANEVSNESGSLLESISTTQIDSSESKDPIPSEEGAVAEDLPVVGQTFDEVLRNELLTMPGLSDIASVFE